MIPGRVNVDAAATPDEPRPEIGLRELFTEFMRVGLSGFGGALPFGRRMLVERRRWLSETEFNELLSLCQLMPGPNIVNVALVVGQRARGLLGALAAITGILGLPMVLVVVAGALYGRYGHFGLVDRALHGVAAVAAGLVLATGIKMVRGLPRRTSAYGFMAAAFAGVALGRLPLGWVLPALGLLSVGWSWRTRDAEGGRPD